MRSVSNNTPIGKIEINYEVKKGVSPLEGLYPGDDWKNIPYFEHTYVITKNGKEIETFKHATDSTSEDIDTVREAKRCYAKAIKNANLAGIVIDAGTLTDSDGEVYEWKIEHDGSGYYRLIVGGYEEEGLTKAEAKKYLKMEMATA